MAGAMIARPDAVRDRVPRPELDRAEQLQRKAGVSLRVERQRGLVPGKAVAIGELRILFLEVPAVGEQKLAQSFGRPGAEDGPVPVKARHAWQRAGMIKMRVRQQQQADIGNLGRDRRPIEAAQIPRTLEQAGIDEFSEIASRVPGFTPPATSLPTSALIVATSPLLTPARDKARDSVSLLPTWAFNSIWGRSGV